MQPEINTEFKLAAEYILHTSKNVFLTGKAGTGKTTFLKYIQQQTKKNTVIVAPTGVAAINAGGVTMHSFFQLPFIPFVPVAGAGFQVNDFVDRNTLFNTIRFNKQKIELFRELELLIIDEASMLRSDLLDCIDTILRHFRRQSHKPFGGVQVLFIGDMFQLPPIVREWDFLKQFYETPFFFSAKALEENEPLFIELKKIYRQNEKQFIDILNRLRHNELTQDDYETLHKRYNPEFAHELENYITLTTHNWKADKKNEGELQKLDGNLFSFKAIIEGEFADNMFPMEAELKLKIGAQVMFIKNDSDIAKRYYNGKLATIKSIQDNKITVQFFDSTNELELNRETWRNVKYNFNREKNKIEEEEIGSFSHFPIRLAWAITIHKSQGLTFEKAIIDAGEAFAAGQVYVALSRCTNLEGIVLQSKIYPSSVKTDERIIAFSEKESSEHELINNLDEGKKEYSKTLLIKAFDWSKVLNAVNDFIDIVELKQIPDKENVEQMALTMLAKTKLQLDVAEKFVPRLEFILEHISEPEKEEELNNLITRAIPFFCNALSTELIQPLNNHIKDLKGKQKVKTYLKECVAIEAILFNKLNQIEKLQFGNSKFYAGNSFAAGIQISDSKAIKAKTEKGDTFKETFNQFKEGKTIEQIAESRGMAITTIEGHIAKFIETGELEISQFVSSNKLLKIQSAINEIGADKLTPLKQMLGDEISFGQIKMSVAHFNFIAKN
jgi:hypothetical protein